MTIVITNVYIDGFNFYYGAIKNTPYKWLNIAKFCQFMLPTPRYQINQIKYYTAAVSARPHDPDQPLRQQIYLRALRTLPNVTIVYGHFLSHEVTALLASPPPGSPLTARVIKTEEKGSDVNLATHLLWDAVQNRYNVAAIISNDSDLVEPIRIVKQELGKHIVIINPHKNNSSRELRQLADDVKTIKPTTLSACQFPVTLSDNVGQFHKPAAW